MSDVKVKLFAIAKDEAAYLPAWVFHHFYFGFDEIEVWLNNIEDNTVAMCEQLTTTYPNFRFKIVDDILENCLANNVHFQRYVYNDILKEERERQLYTHILYLDLDEYWLAQDFQATIKNSIREFPASDTISYLWYFDEAKDERLPFEKNFTLTQQIYKNRHVKSLLKISPVLIKADVHNHHTNLGMHTFEDGADFNVREPETHEGALVSKNKFNETAEYFNKYFIYHLIYKSPIEYVSSLLRGNKQVNETTFLKTNRNGFRKGFDDFDIPFTLDISDKLLADYYIAYQNFLTQNIDILLEMVRGQVFVVSRYNSVVQYIDNESLNDRNHNYRLFNGINLLALIHLNTSHSIDKIDNLTDRNVIIEGWIALNNSGNTSQKNIIFVEFDTNNTLIPITGTVTRLERSDVVAHMDGNIALNCGFSFMGKPIKPIEKVYLYKIDENNIIFVTA